MVSSSCVVAKEKGLFSYHFDICTDTLCLFPENYIRFEYFLHIKMFFNFFAISSTLIRASIAVQWPLVNNNSVKLAVNKSSDFVCRSLKNVQYVEFLAEKCP